MKTYKIHLIRHGITQANLDGKYVGHVDVPLCDQGKAQLVQMVNDFEYPTPDALFCSPLSRCIETAQIIYGDMNPIIIPDLIEYNFGDFEGKTAEELRKNELFSQWLSGNSDFAPPFGESNAQFGKRVCGAFSKIVDGLIKTGTTNVSIVTHGGVIMAILHCFAVPELPMTEWLTPNGCGYTACITPSLWSRMQKFEVFGELPIVEDDNLESSENPFEINKEVLRNANYGFFDEIDFQK